MTFLMAQMKDGTKLPLAMETDKEISVIIPFYRDYPMQNRRYPLPFMIVLAPETEVASIERMAEHIKEEVNIKKLIISGYKQ